MKHKHKFVPIEVAWLSFWSKLEEGKLPVAKYVILVCTCGRIRFVPAKRVYLKNGN